MTGSAFDGEALVAMRRANGLVKVTGASWEEIVVTPLDAVQFLLGEKVRLESEIARLRTRPRLLPFAEPETLDEAVALALAWRYRLSDWEQNFLGSITYQRRPLSPKQQKVIWGIIDKIARMTMAGVA